MARKTKAEAEKTRQALLEAAAQLFSTRGLLGTALTDVAQQAGVTRGALYWHFKDKEDLVRAIWSSFAAPRIHDFFDRRRFDAGTVSAADIRATLHDLLDIVVGDEKVGIALRIALLNVEGMTQEAALQDYLRGERRKIGAALVAIFEQAARAGVLAPGRSPETVASGVVGFLAGLLIEHFLPHPDINLAESGADLLDMFLDGVLRDAPQGAV